MILGLATAYKNALVAKTGYWLPVLARRNHVEKLPLVPRISQQHLYVSKLLPTKSDVKVKRKYHTTVKGAQMPQLR